MNLSDINENDINSIFNPELTTKTAPHNNDVEQSLLGAILMNNSIFDKIDERLRPEHFYAPINQNIFEQIVALRNKGVSFNHTNIDADKEYLTQIILLNAFMVIHYHEYSQQIIDLSIKRKIIEVAEKSIANICSNLNKNPAMEQLANIEQSLFEISKIDDDSSRIMTFNQAVQKALVSAERAHKADGALVGTSTSFASMDKLLGGLQNSDLIILAGRPSMGKTALATNIAYGVAKHNHYSDNKQSVLFFSLEMSAEQLANRIIASEAEVNSHAVMKGQLSKEQMERLTSVAFEFGKMPIIIDETASLNIAIMRNRARRLQRQHNIGLIVVDYLQLLTTSMKNRNFNRVQEVTEITQGLKALAKELNVPVIALSQLSRAVEARTGDEKRPQLADLRDSGSIEQDADVVMFVYREQYYLERSEPEASSEKYAPWLEKYDKCKGKAEIIIAKQRHGAIGTVNMAFEGDKARFRDI